jgi:hypothetical protein
MSWRAFCRARVCGEAHAGVLRELLAADRGDHLEAAALSAGAASQAATGAPARNAATM